jgi:hypothetical protein
MPTEYASAIAIVALVVALLAVLLSLWLALRLRRAGRRGRPTVASIDNLDEVVGELRRIDALAASLAEQTARLDVVEGQARRSVQRVGVVRYNPFEDTGSNQSFALALLDSRADGIVLSSLHSRQATRIYIKPITGGRSETALSDEETEALRRAGSPVDRPA